VARIARDRLGGTIEETGAEAFALQDSALGRLKIYLDTSWGKEGAGAIERKGVELAKGLIPVEIVTDPLDPADFSHLDTLCTALRDAGAAGSGQGWLYGFGVHFNPEITGDDPGDILPALTAYALVEDWLRDRIALDTTRRLMPFVDRYPAALVDVLAARDIAGTADLAARYLEISPSRNHGLDMLPILAHLHEEMVEAAMGADSLVSARPTFHYRLPDCRIDEPGWSVAGGWNDWVAIEALAARSDVLDALCDGWRARRGGLTLGRDDWRRSTGEILMQHGLVQA